MGSLPTIENGIADDQDQVQARFLQPSPSLEFPVGRARTDGLRGISFVFGSLRFHFSSRVSKFRKEHAPASLVMQRTPLDVPIASYLAYPYSQVLLDSSALNGYSSASPWHNIRALASNDSAKEWVCGVTDETTRDREHDRQLTESPDRYSGFQFPLGRSMLALFPVASPLRMFTLHPRSPCARVPQSCGYLPKSD
jgi:hypothetical protein